MCRDPKFDDRDVSFRRRLLGHPIFKVRPRASQPPNHRGFTSTVHRPHSLLYIGDRSHPMVNNSTVYRAHSHKSCVAVTFLKLDLTIP